MASANLDLVRSIVAAWQHGDFSSVEWAHSEIAEPKAGDFTHGEWADPQTP